MIPPVDVEALPEDWDDEQRALFVRLHRLLSENQCMVTHPHAATIPARHWDTIAWNVAHLAVDPPADDMTLVLYDSDSNEEFARERPRSMQ